MEQLADEVVKRLQPELPAALLLGTAPKAELGFRYTRSAPYDAVVIGSLSVSEFLHIPDERVYLALLQGLPVYLYEDGLAHRAFQHTANRPLWAKLLERERYLKTMGVRFVGGTAEKRVLTAQAVRQRLAAGQAVPKNARLTPLARDILEGKAP